jgi:TRAP-type C4-dicarboxylate transport system permease small subunit
MLFLQQLNRKITEALLILAAVLAFLLCFLVVADVIGRVVFNSPVKGTTEIVSLTVVVICYLQVGYAIRSGGMLQVDMFVGKLGPRGQSLMSALCALGGMVFFAVVFLGSIDGAAHAWTSNEFEGEGALRVPVWPTRFVLVAGAFLAGFNYLLMFVVQCGRALRNEAPAPFSVGH